MALAAATLPGCVQPPEMPTVQLPIRWENAPSTRDGPDSSRIGFWRALGDEQLEQLVVRALDGNPGVAQAGHRIAAARALQGAAGSRLLPEVGVVGNARARRSLEGRRSDTGGLSAPGPGIGGLETPRTTGTYEAGFDASWEIPLFGRREATLAGAAADLAAAEAEAGAARTSLAAEVGRTYAALRAAQAREDLLLATARSQDRLATVVRIRRTAGIASDADVERVAAAPDRTRAQAAEATEAAQRALHRLATLVGEARTDADLVGAARAAERQPRVPDGVVARTASGGVPADLLRARPEIRRAEAAVLRAGADAGLARAELWPRLTLGGSLTVSGTPLGASLFSPAGPQVAAGLGPSLTMPLFDWGQRRAVVDARDASFRAAVEGYRQSVLEGLEEVEVALVASTRAREREVLLERSTARAAEALRLADIVYRQGLSSLVERLEAEAAWLGARLELVTAREEAFAAAIALHKALGGSREPSG